MKLGIGLAITDVTSRGNGGPPPFTPASISGLGLWLDAADTATITQSGGSVSQWNDKSGNGYNVTQPTGSFQPTTGTRTLNSKNVIDFNNDSLICPAGLIAQISNSDVTCFCVFTSDSGGTKQVVFSGLSNGFETRFGFIRTSGNLLMYIHASIGAENFGITQAISANTPVIAYGSNVGTQQSISVSGAPVSSNANAVTNSDLVPMFIGSYRDNVADQLDGYIAEIIIYNRGLSNSEANQVGNYLEAKWGITWTNI